MSRLYRHPDAENRNALEEASFPPNILRHQHRALDSCGAGNADGTHCVVDSAGPQSRLPDGEALTLPNVALEVIDRAIQVHGGMGVTEDVPLAGFWAHLRAMRIADGPDEVHKRTIASQELCKQRQRRADAAERT